MSREGEADAHMPNLAKSLTQDNAIFWELKDMAKCVLRRLGDDLRCNDDCFSSKVTYLHHWQVG